MTKDELQEESSNAWGRLGKGVLCWITAVGKTRCLIISALKVQKTHPNATVIVIVPTNYLKGQWEDELKKFHVKNYTVYVINTAIKLQLSCDLLLIDEIHRMVAKSFIKLFSCIKYRWIFGATATLERSDGKDIFIRKNLPIISTVDYKRALENKWISDFTIYNIPVNFNRTDQLNYKKLNDEFNRHFGWFGHDFNVAFNCMTANGAKTFKEIHNIDLEVGQIIGIANKWRNAMQNRQNLIYNCDAKIEATKYLLERIDNKTLTFSMTNEFTDKLTESLGDIAISYHSDKSKKHKDSVIEQFRSNSSIRVINTTKSFDEGVDLPEVNYGINESNTSIGRQMIQRLGRLIRYVEGKHAIFICLYVRGSKEEKTLKQCQKNIPNIIWLNSIDQIENTEMLRQN